VFLSKVIKVGLLEVGNPKKKVKVLLIPFLGNGQMSYNLLDEITTDIIKDN